MGRQWPEVSSWHFQGTTMYACPFLTGCLAKVMAMEFLVWSHSPENIHNFNHFKLQKPGGLPDARSIFTNFIPCRHLKLVVIRTLWSLTYINDLHNWPYISSRKFNMADAKRAAIKTRVSWLWRCHLTISVIIQEQIFSVECGPWCEYVP